jgi:hypothetical protein
LPLPLGPYRKTRSPARAAKEGMSRQKSLARRPAEAQFLDLDDRFRHGSGLPGKAPLLRRQPGGRLSARTGDLDVDAAQLGKVLEKSDFQVTQGLGSSQRKTNSPSRSAWPSPAGCLRRFQHRRVQRHRYRRALRRRRGRKQLSRLVQTLAHRAHCGLLLVGARGMFEAQQVFERRLEIQRQRLTVDRDLETGCAMHMGASLAGKSWQRQQTGTLRSIAAGRCLDRLDDAGRRRVGGFMRTRPTARQHGRIAANRRSAAAGGCANAQQPSVRQCHE